MILRIQFSRAVPFVTQTRRDLGLGPLVCTGVPRRVVRPAFRRCVTGQVAPVTV